MEVAPQCTQKFFFGWMDGLDPTQITSLQRAPDVFNDVFTRPVKEAPWNYKCCSNRFLPRGGGGGGGGG